MLVDFEILHPSDFCVIYRATNTKTGEIVFERVEDNLGKALSAGLSEIDARVTIKKQETKYGAECYSISTPGGEIHLVGWKAGGRPPKRGGKKSYVKLNPDTVSSLPDELLAPLVKLAPYIKVNGLLTDKKRRRRLSKNAVLSIWGYGINKGARIWGLMVDAGILYEQEEGFYLNRIYLSRG